jgi:hypothetical protein
LLLIAGVSLSACSKPESDTLALNTSGADSGRPEDRFGKGFGEKFRADANSEPKEVEENDVPPVSLTTEPLPVD